MKQTNKTSAVLPVLFIPQSKSRPAKPQYNKPQFFTIADYRYVYSVWDRTHYNGVLCHNMRAEATLSPYGLHMPKHCEKVAPACGSNAAFLAIIRSDFLVLKCDVRIGFMYMHLV